MPQPATNAHRASRDASFLRLYLFSLIAIFGLLLPPILVRASREEAQHPRDLR